MLKNKLIMKKIRNICILLMAIIIMIGVYTNIRRSRAENVIQVELEVSDKSETLEAQKIIVEATETNDGNYLLELPTSVKGNIVTKYYTAGGAEVDMKDANANKTLTLTDTEVNEQKMQLQIDYDKKEVTTENGETITLYNKELMGVKDTEENANAENTEGADNEAQENETQTTETTDETIQEPELDDTVIVTGYMPLDAQVDIQKIDVSTMNIQLPNNTQTIQDAYEVSVYQMVRNTIDENGNVIATEIVKPETENEENTAVENTSSDNLVEENTTTENIASESTTQEDGTHIEEEKVEYDPSVYNESLIIKTKNTEENLITSIYSIQEDNQVIALTSIEEGEYLVTPVEKNNQTVKYIFATGTVPVENADIPNDEPSDEGIATMAITDGNMLRSTSGEVLGTARFLGNQDLERQNIDNVTFLSSISGANDTAWDVSAEQNGSIMAWYENNPNGSVKVYIGSNEKIYANTNSTCLFSYIGYSEKCTSTETITNIELLDTSNVTNMSHMFENTGYNAMTSLDLGDNFDTSNVTNMQSMFSGTGSNAMITLDLGDNFDTSKVTNMDSMFLSTGEDAMTSLSLGDKFDTSNVTTMQAMFASAGSNSMTSLDLGDKFDTSKVTDMTMMFTTTGTKSMTSLNLGRAFTNIAESNMLMFEGTGKTGEIVIYAPKEIYEDSTHLKLNETSNVTIAFGNGTINEIVNVLRSTSGETSATSGFLGNTSIQRQNIANVTFVSSTSGANSTAWDVSSAGDNSILAWYEQNINGYVKVYIGSNDDIYANTDSTNLFRYIGFSEKCTLTEVITNLDLLNTSNVTNMSGMFAYTGYTAMTSLDLGDNFDTSNVKTMGSMFEGTGYTAMTSLNVGDKFDTSNVTDMAYMFNMTGRVAITSLDLGDNFDTSNVTTMLSMFSETGYTAMTSLNLGEKFNTSNVTNMNSMFYSTGIHAMTSLDLGDKFDISNATDMSWMFNSTGAYAMTSLDLGPAFTNISSTNSRVFNNTGKSGCVIQAPEAIYQDSTHFKLSTDSSTTISFTTGTINPKYRTEWVKQSVQVNTSSKNVRISLRGTTNQEVATNEYVSDVTSSLSASNIKIFVDDTEVTDSITKSLGSATQTTNTRTGAKDVLQVLTLSNFEEAVRQTGKDYTEWSGNIRVEVAQGTLTDTYGNKNMELASDGSRDDNNIEDATTDRNTTNALFADFIKPEFTYNFSSTDIDRDAKTLTVDFSITDKYFNSSSVLTNTNNITVKMLDTNVVPENLTKTLRKVQDITETRDGTSVKIGEKYRLIISGFEQASIAEDGNYKEYSGPVSIIFPAGIAKDKSGNTTVQKNITVGIDEPDGTGNEEIVDVITPSIEKIDSSVDVAKKTAQLTFQVTDKYFSNSTLTNANIQVLVNGSVNTSIAKQITSTPLNEQRVVNGATSTVQYGMEYTVTLTGIDTTVNQIKVRIPESTMTDTSGNGNPETDFILFNTLKSASGERNNADAFLENANIERQNIDNVTFMNYIPDTVYDNSTNTYVDSTAWDVSAMGDNSIIAWYESSTNETVKVYIGSNEEIFGNVDSSYLFAHIGYSSNCTATETISNIGLLNTGNVTDMSRMFYSTGYTAMTSLDLGDNFDTSNVTDMSFMFYNTGGQAMTSLDLGDKFDTSKVTDMHQMFFDTGYTAMTTLNLGDKFDTSNVTTMRWMFMDTGYTAMTSLDLGDKFDTSNVTTMQVMFYRTGYQAMTSLDLGDNFDTSKVTDMQAMFFRTGYQALTSLDLGDKFNTSSVTNMGQMFSGTGQQAMTSLDLGPAFTNIAETNIDMFTDTGKSGEIVIQAPEAIYQNSTNFKLNTDSSTTIEFTNGTINPKYRTEWIKETVQTDTTVVNNPKLNITLRGTTNTEVASDEYISDVTSSLTTNDIKVFVDNTEVTDIITKSLGTATQTNNTRTGAKDVLQVLILSNFEEATRRTGKSYKEWSGNIRVEVAQGTLSDTTGPADETGNRITYGNKNMEVVSADTQTGAETGAGSVTEIGARIDNIIEDPSVDQNTANTMFIDYIKPEFTYQYSQTDINYEEKTLTVDFSVTDKYLNTSTVLTNKDNITVQMLDTNVVPENLTKTLTKVEDITENRDGQDIKIGETYRLVVSGFEQASIENGKYKEYSGPVSIIFPAGMVSDKSGNSNVQKNITIGIDEPENTGSAEIVDVVTPIWEARNLQIDEANNKVTVDLYGTDKYYEEDTLDISKIKVIIDGEEITSTTNVVKQLSAPTVLTENRDGANAQYGVKYTLTLSNFVETDTEFGASDKAYREYSGETELQIEAGTLVDESGNASIQTTLDLGKIDFINPDILKVSSSKNDTNKTETIVFDVIDKDLATSQISTTDTSKIHVYVDNEEAEGVTKTITNVQDLNATINGNSRVIGKRYTLVLSNFEQPRTSINYNREYSDWSGDVSITIDAGTVTDNSENENEETTLAGDFVDFIKPNVTYQYTQTDIDHDGKSFTMVFDVTDKFYNSGTLALEDLAIRIDGEEPDWAEVNRSLQVEDRTNMVNGESKVIGQRYTLTLSNLEQLQVKEGDNYLDYSGVITVAIPADKITDTTGNTNSATTITSGITLPGGAGTEEVVDVVDPLVEKISSSVDTANKTAEVTFKVTDKYFANSTLTNTNIQVLVNGSVNTTITKQVTSTVLNEQRVVDGTSSTVQYGVQYTVTLTGIDTTVNQIKVRVPEGLVTDTSGNGNKETDLILFNTLKNASTETEAESAFLGNTNIQRQNIDNVTFMNYIPDTVYDVSNDTYIDNTAWDASAMGDNSIIAWYETNTNGTVKVYIGSNEDIFGNVDSSYLFAYIGTSTNCTATETITNIELLNTGNVTNMSYMFQNTGYTAMTSLDLGNNFDTSNVTNMSNMFSQTGYTSLISLTLGDKFDTSNVTDMSYMFSSTGYGAMESFSLGEKFNTSRVTNMNGMFITVGFTALTDLDLGNEFDTSNVTNMSQMFSGAGFTAMTNLNLGDKFDTSNVTDMSSMFSATGSTAMTNLNLGDKFDTSKVTNMYRMFSETGRTVMTSLDLGDKFNTNNVTNMERMFLFTGQQSMTSLDLGPAFTNIAESNENMIFTNTGKTGEIVIQAPEAIYQDSTNFKLNTDSTTNIEFTNGTINPKYRTEWIKESVQTDTADANNPKLNITLRGTTNTEVASDEYISDVTSSLSVNDIKVFVDNTEVTDIITKSLGTATQTNNTRTGAKDVLQVLILSNFEEATRRTGKSYKEWSGNIRVEVAQGTLSDTTGPADETGNRITYGNKNMEVVSADTQTGAETGAGSVTEIGARIDNIIEDPSVDQNTANTMFIDYIKPEFTYQYSQTDINYEEKTLTVDFSVTDKYLNTSTVLTNKDNIIVQMLDTNVVPENLTKTLTKVEDITENRNGQDVKIGETYRLVVSGFEQASIENGMYKEYSGPVSIIFPAGMVSDKSGNSNVQKNITIGIDEPENTGSAEIVDVVTPIWEATNLQIDKANNKVTVDLYGTDKYYAEDTLDISKIKVIIDGEEVTSTENVTKELSAPTPLTETRDGANAQYGVKYTLTLSNWKESDTVFQASEKEYREYSGNTEIQIEAGTLVDTSGNENIQTTLNLGMIDIIDPEVYQISSTKDDTAKTATIVFEVVDKYFKSAQISTTDTSKLTVYVDDEEAIGVTTTITNEEDMTATVNGTSRVIGKRYTLVISNFEQPRTTINYDREYSDWSGDVTVKIDAGTIVDESGNSNQEQE